MDKLTFWQEFKLRLKSETPKFFKRLRAIALYWSGGVGAAYGLLKTGKVDLPDRTETTIVDLLSYAFVALVVVTGGTFLPTMNKAILREEVKEDIVEKTKDVMIEKVGDIKPEDIKK